MRLVRSLRTIPAIGLGFILATPAISLAQGPPISSGSGSGTGTGMSSSSLGATGTGNESTTGLGSTGTGREGLPTLGGRPNRPRFNGDLTTPNELGLPQNLPSGTGRSQVDPQLLQDARSIQNPGERSLALVRIAQTAILSKQLIDAHQVLFDAVPASLAEQQPLVRQQRMVAVIDTLLSLAEERMSASTDVLRASDDIDAVPPPPADSNPGSRNLGSNLEGRTPAAALPEDSRQRRLREALPEWEMAVYLATRLDDVTTRTEALFRIVESEAFSSQRLITDPTRSFSRLRPDPANLPIDLRSFSDELLTHSAAHAALIERPIWRDQATYSIISNAAASSQFNRGFQIAREVLQPEARTNVLIRLAEGQAINNRPDEATVAYAEAAQTVALIPQNDPRETLIGVLIDSLISFGRFEDARASVQMYNTASRQIVAYSAIAESMGRRGLVAQAHDWIAREAPEPYKALLDRKVADGQLVKIEQNRSRDLSPSRGSFQP